MDYVIELLRLAKRKGPEEVFVHLITDGRSSRSDRVPILLEHLGNELVQIGAGRIVSLMGRGFALDLQGDTLMFSGYMFDEQGNPIWYLSSGLLDANNLFQGNWSLYAGGQTLTGAYQAPTVIDDNVGVLRLQFLSETSAVLTLPNGSTIGLVRFRF